MGNASKRPRQILLVNVTLADCVPPRAVSNSLFQPLSATDPARNRRIELRLTNR